MIDFAALAAPFPPDRVSWRVGTSNKKKRQREHGPNAKATSGQALAYLDARDVMARLDEVCGPAGWQNRYSHADKKTICEIGIWLGGEWVWKADGAGDSDIEAEKGALSDAFKRAAVRWGIGRYLYDVPSPWVDLDEWEQITDAGHAKLRKLLQGFGGATVAHREPANESRAKSGELSDACRLASELLKTCSTRALLIETWEKNKVEWKSKLPAEEFAALIKARNDHGASLPAEAA